MKEWSSSSESAGAQQRGIGEGARAAESAVRGQQQQGTDAFATATDEFGHVEPEGLEQVAVGVAFGVFLEKPGEEIFEQRGCLLQLGAEGGVGRVHALGQGPVIMRVRLVENRMGRKC